MRISDWSSDVRSSDLTQEEFISIVSHELRTPVAGVLGFLQTTMDHWSSMTDTERFNAVRRSASNARRLQGLTRDVLDSQAVESGRMSYAMGDADLAEEVSVAVEAASAMYPRLTIAADVEAERVPVVIDVDRIQQVLTNLLDNAAKASPPNGTVTVRLWEEGEQVMVSVTDQGPGLSAELQDRVFDKFVRGRDSNVSGTGLGLYICRQILEAQDGEIHVEIGGGRGRCLWEWDQFLVSRNAQGPCLAAERQDSGFDKVVRGRDSNVSGTGRGLYSSRQIRDAHDGEIHVETGGSGGATFTFSLPAAPVARR